MPGQQQPYENWWGSSFPTTVFAATTDLAAGNRYQLLVPGRIVGARVAQNGSSANVVGVVCLTINGGSGSIQGATRQKPFAPAASYPVWRRLYFHPLVRVAAGDIALVWVKNQQTTLLHTPGLVSAADIDHGNIRALKDGGTSTTFNGTVGNSGTTHTFVPFFSNSGGLFGIDLIFLPD